MMASLAQTALAAALPSGERVEVAKGAVLGIKNAGRRQKACHSLIQRLIVQDEVYMAAEVLTAMMS